MLCHLSRALCSPVPVPIGILGFEEVGAELETGLFRLMLQEVDQHSENSWKWLLQLFLFPPPHRNQHVLQLRISCQVAGNGEVQRFPNGELVRDSITSGSAKKKLI